MFKWKHPLETTIHISTASLYARINTSPFTIVTPIVGRPYLCIMQRAPPEAKSQNKLSCDYCRSVKKKGMCVRSTGEDTVSAYINRH